MMNYLCVVSYLGHSYKGWQKQPGLNTVQGKIEECLSLYLNSPISISGGGRTDAGVNALGQVFSFHSDRPIPSKESFLYAMNHRLLPSDISILSIEEKDESFHARHSSVSKTYLYSFRLGEKKPLESVTIAQMGTREFFLSDFLSSLKLLVGTHKFWDFTNKMEDVGDYVRTIYRIDVEIDDKDNPKLISVKFKGNRFMTYQVRIMMGASFRVGFGNMALDEFKSHLDSLERNIINFKAPAEGLTFVEVGYEKPNEKEFGFFVNQEEC